MEAQASGCVVVASGLAALNETVHFGDLILGTPHDVGFEQKFVDAVVKQCHSWTPSNVEKQRNLMEEKYDWVNTAKHWVKDYINPTSLPYST